MTLLGVEFRKLGVLSPVVPPQECSVSLELGKTVLPIFLEGGPEASWSQGQWQPPLSAWLQWEAEHWERTVQGESLSKALIEDRKWLRN